VSPPSRVRRPVLRLVAVRAGTLPAGRYVTVSEVGHPDRLVDVTADLLRWAADAGLAWGRQPGPDPTASGGGAGWRAT
jgi:hypothetical protein